MEFSPEWISAGAATFTLLGVGVNWSVVRPLSQKLTAQNAEMDEQKRTLEMIKERQEQRIAAIGTEQGRMLEDIRDRLELHEKSDTERFDDQGERLDAKIDGLRREIASGHIAAVAQIKIDGAGAISELKQDIRQLCSRIDALTGAVSSSLNRHRGSDYAAGDD